MVYLLSLHGYNCFDRVMVRVHLAARPDPSERANAYELEWTADVPEDPGVSPEGWVRDALVAALEQL